MYHVMSLSVVRAVLSLFHTFHNRYWNKRSLRFPIEAGYSWVLDATGADSFWSSQLVNVGPKIQMQNQT